MEFVNICRPILTTITAIAYGYILGYIVVAYGIGHHYISQYLGSKELTRIPLNDFTAKHLSEILYVLEINNSFGTFLIHRHISQIKTFLRIDTSGESVNCSAPFNTGWMCGSPQCYYIVQSIR